MQNYQVCEKIGSGGFSSVYRCYNTTTTFNSKVFALKKIQVKNLNSINLALKEAQCSLQFNHPHIVKLYEFFIDKHVDVRINQLSHMNQQQQNQQQINYDVYNAEFPSNETWFVCLALEYCAQGTLKDVITKCAAKKSTSLLSLSKVMKWMFQILSGLSHIHESRLVHRDLKPENVFIHDGDVKIGDLGLAKAMETSVANTVLGTSSFMAPEIRTENPAYNFKVDVWGAGCILCELLTRKRMDYAYEMAMSPKKIFDLINTNYANEDQESLSNVLEMMKSMLTHDPEGRPDVNFILNKYFMANIPTSQPHLLVPQQIISPLSMIYESNNESSSSSNSSGKRDLKASMKHTLQRLMLRTLNLDCYVMIFSYLPGDEVIRCGLVCSWWHEIISTCNTLYKLLFKSMYHIDVDADDTYKEMRTKFKSVRDSYLYRAKLDHNYKSGKYQYTGLQLHDIGKSISSLHLYTGDKITNNYIKTIYEQRPAPPKPTKVSKKKDNQPATRESVEFGGAHAMVLTGADDTVVRLFDIGPFGEGKPVQATLLRSFTGHKSAVLTTQFRPEIIPRLLFTAGYDKQICIFDIFTGEDLYTFHKASDQEIWDLGVMNSDTIVCSASKQLKAYSITSREPFCTLDHGHKGVIYALKRDESETFGSCFASASADGCVSLFDLRNRQLTKPLTIDGDGAVPVYEVAWDRYNVVAGTSTGVVESYDIRKLANNTLNHASLFSVKLSNNGAVRGLRLDSTKIICGSLRGPITVSNRQNGRFLYQMKHNENSLHKSTNMSCLDATDEIVMGSDFHSVLSIFDFTPTKQQHQQDLNDSFGLDDTETSNSKKNACRTQ